MIRSRIYLGSLSHHRGGSIKNNFTYKLYSACLDLDEIDLLSSKLRLFSLDRRNLFSVNGSDYALLPALSSPSQRPAPKDSLRERANRLLQSVGLRTTPARIELVTQLRVAGYVFNPVSFFLAYDDSDQLLAAVAEINNTYDQTFSYVLDDRYRTQVDASTVTFRTEKAFFVSPFIGDRCTYEWHLPRFRRENELDIRMQLSRPTGRFFAARLKGTSIPFTDGSLVRALMRFPLMPTQIWTRIHLQALRLRVRGLQYRRPTS